MHCSASCNNPFAPRCRLPLLPLIHYLSPLSLERGRDRVREREEGGERESRVWEWERRRMESGRCWYRDTAERWSCWLGLTLWGGGGGGNWGLWLYIIFLFLSTKLWGYCSVWRSIVLLIRPRTHWKSNDFPNFGVNAPICFSVIVPLGWQPALLWGSEWQDCLIGVTFLISTCLCFDVNLKLNLDELDLRIPRCDT